MDDAIKLRNFLEIPYDELEEKNLESKEKRAAIASAKLEAEHRAYLEKEKHIKTVMLCFSDIEGRFHMLDYDKKFLLQASDNLTFDGSSIRGFTAQKESDLRLEVDWGSLMWLPSDLFGSGKVVMFTNVLRRDKKQYESDFRGLLQGYAEDLKKKEDIIAYAAPELEGFLFDGINAEQEYDEKVGFKAVSKGGYFHSLPMDKLRQFINSCADAQRAMGFKNEKDHPEVAPGQFEINFSYTDIVRAADQIQLYKLVCRQVADKMGMTASFLPKPIMGVNGSGMHTNFSLTKNGKNIFFDSKGEEGLSKVAWDFISKLLNHAPEICLIINSSVNAYRRLDPHFEAPNQIKVSSCDRGSMIRIPVGNERSARIEVRSVAPDTNPYLWFYTLIKTGMTGEKLTKDKSKKDIPRFLPGTINDALKIFKASDYVAKVLGEENKEKFVRFKELVADRAPKELGTLVKKSEVIYHHEVTNQTLWNTF
jgi:glutamine synthetase